MPWRFEPKAFGKAAKMFDIVGVAVLVGLTVALGWLARRAWRSTRRVLKWVGATFCCLLALVVGTALVVALVGY